MSRRTLRMEMNRVEGDLEVKLEVEGHTVTDAWCIGTMYRGYEQILLGRDPQDVLVITPRICGICALLSPFVYSLASRLGLVSTVQNDASGGCIGVEGDPMGLATFRQAWVAAVST